MITIGLKKGPTKDDLIESFERYGRENSDGVLFITDDDTVMVGHISGLEYDTENKDAFCFSGFFSQKFLRGYYHTKTHKGWIETDLSDLSTIQGIRMMVEKCEKVHTKNHTLFICQEQIDIETARMLAKNGLVYLPKVKELAKILEEIGDNVFTEIIPMGHTVLKKNGDAYFLREHDLQWVFLTEDSLKGATKHTMYGVVRESNGDIKPYAEIKIGELPTLASVIFVLA